MPVFTLLVVLAVALLWVLLSAVYKPLGKFAGRLWNDAIEAMSDDDDKEI